MKYLAATLFLCSASLFAQNSGVEMASVTPHRRPGFISNSTSAQKPDLGGLLGELDRITTSTKTHISALPIEKWKSGWQTAWLKSSSGKHEAKQLAASLETNLSEAMPLLIHQAEQSAGSMSATFKLYKDLSAVVECVGVLEEMSASYGKRGESAFLHDDYAALGRLRQDLASYIQLTADSLEPMDRTPGSISPLHGTMLSASKLVSEGSWAR